jgi:DNA transformation protein
MLAAAGIVSIDQLKALGAAQAFVRVKRAGGKPSLNLLWGLESAISGEPWQDVAKNHRTTLLLALEDAERMQAPSLADPRRLV